MNVIKRIFPLVLLLSFALTSFAQDKAKNIIAASQKKLESLSDFSAKITYGLENIKMPNPVVRKGEIKYKGGKFVILLADQHIYCDGQKQWTYLPEDNEVSIVPYYPDEGFDIESIFKVYEASAEPRYEGVETANEIKCDKIFLAVKDPSLDYNRATLWVSQKDKFLVKAVLTDRKQTSTTYGFSDIKVNQGLSTSNFQFDPSKHPGVVVYDETE
ncbi:MAG: outer membrane lipoprotein carrier protein LolA [Bacteroidota bacterium]